MYKFKYINGPINFNQASDLFNSLSRANEIKILSEKNILKKFKFLQLSIKNNKDISALNPNTIDSPYLLGLNKKKLTKELYISLLQGQKLSYSFGFFISTLKFNLKYEHIKIFFLELCKFIIGFLISLTDTVLIFFVAIYFLIKNKFESAKYNYLNKVKEIYTIYFWKNKGINSIKYYYPDFDERKNALAYATAISQYKYFFIGFLNTNKYKNICTALDFIDLTKLIKSLLQLIIIYLFDLRIFFNPTFGLVIKYFQSFRYINKTFVTLLNYNASYKILKLNSINCIYAWFENQSCIKGLLFGWSKYLNYLKNKNLDIYIYYGFLFTKNGLNQNKPTYSELLLSNYLTNNFLFQNNESAKEMKSFFYKNKFNLKFSVVRESLKKYIQGYEDKTLNKKNKKRNFTIISNHEFNELSIICYRLINFIRNNPIYNYNHKTVLHIRLHPTLDSKKTYKRLIDFARENNLQLPHIEFINNEKETLMSSLENTKYAIFGHSPLINLALSYGIKVIAFRTNFLSQLPIYEKYLTSKLIEIIN